MSKFPRIQQKAENEGGYSDWLQPQMDKPYKMACCDCSLVHDMEFKVVRIVKDMGNGCLQVKDAPSGKFAVHLRAKRNDRSTGQMRRHKKPTA